MAYASLVSLSQTIQKLLCDQDRYPISPHENQQIIHINDYVNFLQTFLEHYSNKASSLEGRISDTTNEGEDIIEYFMWKQIDQQQNYTARPECPTKVSHQIGKRFYFNRYFRNVKKVAEEIESIAAEVMEIKNSARAKDVRQLTDSSSVATSSSRLIIASTSGKSDAEMVGFKDQLMTIKALLCGESSKLQVIPITGMGGLGKTTLAKSAYDDQLTVEHFYIRAWVTVSQYHNTRRILSNLIACTGAECSEKSDESKMAESIYRCLKGRRYLLVMDDMWSTKAWDDVRRIFPEDRNGSRIILTTRLLDVAAYPDSSSPLHHMRFLYVEESWNLLEKKVFQGGNCPPELEDIGKTIARSCRGLPLAILVIAGVLSTVSQTLTSWENIEIKVIESVTTNDEQFADIVLSLSYNHLPHHLRPCFLYMSAFQEDYEIRVSELIKLWVAEGFLKSQNGPKSYEEVAEEYLEDLVKRSLVLVTRRKYNGKIKRCRMHDVVQGLCIKKAQQEKFLARVKYRKAPRESMINQRRVSIAHCAYLGDIEAIYCSPIHTIICTEESFGDWYRCMQVRLRYTRLLRVLDVREELYKWNPSHHFNHINKLFHLRYLALPYDSPIPTHISNLKNFQTLIIYGGINDIRLEVVCLEFEVWRMPQLRHLVTSYYFGGLPDPNATHFPLENLQTLSLVKNFKCTKEVLLMIPNLKKLGIYYSAGVHVGGLSTPKSSKFAST